MAQEGAAAAISRGRRGGDVTPPSREPRPSLLSFLRKRSAEKMSPEEETCPKRRKTGGRRIGEDFSLWEKWQLLQTHEKELALSRQKSSKRNWSFWSPLAGQRLWSHQLLRWSQSAEEFNWAKLFF